MHRLLVASPLTVLAVISLGAAQSPLGSRPSSVPPGTRLDAAIHGIAQLSGSPMGFETVETVESREELIDFAVLWLIGTTRVLGIENDSDGGIPSALRRYLSMTSPDYSYVFGDFDVCPLEPDRPGHLRFACITDGRQLVVQNLRRERPPFRLLYSWPPTTR